MARDLPLPPLWGAGNDYSFLEQRLDAAGRLHGIDGYRPSAPLSVVIAAHNRVRLLELCLESLAAQDYPADLLEIVVVDDKSTDDPASVCARWGDRVRYVPAPFHPGHTEGMARNTGIRAARHPVILQMDPDILFANPDALRWIARWFETDADPVVTVSRRFIRSDGVTAEGVRHCSFPKDLTGDDDGREIFRSDPHILKHRHMPYLEVLGFSMAYRRASALDAGLYAEDWIEYGGVDQEFAYRLYERGAYCIHEPHVDAYHLHHQYAERSGRHREFLASRIPAYRVHRYPGRYPGRIDVPRCSIYIPVRNGARYLGDAIRSAQRQTARDLEIVAVDDGSTDATPRLLEQAAASDPRIRWRRTDPRGCAAATNTAVGIARGEFILQLDCDDVLMPEAVESLIGEFDRHPWLGMVFGRLARTDEHLVPQRFSESFKNYRRHQTMLCMHVSAPRMWRRRVHHLVGGHNEALTSAVDYDIALRISERAPIQYLDRVLYLYRIHAGSLSGDIQRQRENGLAAVRDSLRRMGLADRYQPRLNLTMSNRWYSFEAQERYHAV